MTEQGWQTGGSWFLEDAEHHPAPMAELAITLGAEVREVREGLGWSRSVLVRRSGTTRSWLTRLEDGNGVPSVAVLQRIAEAMGKRLWITLIDEKDTLPPHYSARRAVERNEQGA